MLLPVLNRRVARLVAVGLLLCAAPMYLHYKTTQFPKHRNAPFIVDFSSFLLSYITLPIIRRFFTIPETDWNRDREVEGLQMPVDVYRDDMGIPYIFAHSTRDAKFAQLFIEYTERPFQCEFLRRLAAGRLSETFGEKVLPSDYRIRLLVDADFIRYRMEKLSPEQKAQHDNAVKALNQAASLLPAVPVELAALGWTRTEWTTEEYFKMLAAMHLEFIRGYGIEYSRTTLQKLLKEYWPSFNVKHLREVPFLNVEGDFPSLFDQQGNRQPLPPLPDTDDSWAKWRPDDLAKMLANLRSAQAPEKQQAQAPAAPEAAAGEETPSNAHAEATTPEAESRPVKVEQWAGSNAWAVSGRFTASGKPILSSDTHLAATAPGFWMPVLVSVGPSKLLTTQQQHPSSRGSSSSEARKTKTGNEEEWHEKQHRVAGVSAVGVGTVCVGHNEYAAWGQTIAATDTADFFLVTLNEAGTHYLYDGKWYPLRMRVEEFFVKGTKEGKVEKVLRYTHHGPLLSDAVPALQKLLKPREALALATVACRAPVSTDYFTALAKARTWHDFIAAGSLAQQLALATVWATAGGDIGGTVGGAIPIRTRTENSAFRDGTSSAADWQGVLPQTKMAHAVNPERGFVAMANSKIARDMNALYGESFSAGFRQRRLAELLHKLTKRGNITVQDMIAMQNDVETISGREFGEYVLQKVLFAYAPRTADAPQQQKEAQHIREICRDEGLSDEDGTWLHKTLGKWDGDMGTESIAATIYDVWAQWTVQNLFKLNGFPDEATEIVLGKSPDGTWLPTMETGTHWPYNILRALRQNEEVVADVTTPERLLCSSAAATLAWLRKRYGEDSLNWKWGLVRVCFIEHILAGGLRLLYHTASVGPLRWGGSTATVKAHSKSAGLLSMEKPREEIYAIAGIAPVLRMVVDLGDLKNSYWAVLPGVSGWVGSKHYDNFASNIEATRGTAHMRPMLWTDEQIAAAAVTHMRLLPKAWPSEKKGDQKDSPPREEL